jgi:hypothetical protein
VLELQLQEEAVAEQTKKENHSSQALIAEMQTGLKKKQTELEVAQIRLESIQKELDISKSKLSEDCKTYSKNILKLQKQAELADKKVLELQEELKNCNAMTKQTEEARNTGQGLIANLQFELQKEQAELKAATNSLVSVQKELGLLKVTLTGDAERHHRQILDLQNQMAEETRMKAVLEEDSRLIKKERDVDQAALKAANVQVLQLTERMTVVHKRAELTDKRVLQFQEEKAKRDAMAKQTEEEMSAGQALIAKLKIDLQEEQAKSAELDAASKAQRDSLHFQLAVHQLLRTQPNPHESTWLRSPCSAAPPESWLHAFGKCVERAFIGTRVSHRRSQLSAHVRAA